MALGNTAGKFSTGEITDWVVSGSHCHHQGISICIKAGSRHIGVGHQNRLKGGGALKGLEVAGGGWVDGVVAEEIFIGGLLAGDGMAGDPIVGEGNIASERYIVNGYQAN